MKKKKRKRKKEKRKKKKKEKKKQTGDLILFTVYIKRKPHLKACLRVD